MRMTPSDATARSARPLGVASTAILRPNQSVVSGACGDETREGLARDSREDVTDPGRMSRRRREPSGVPSVTHSSRPRSGWIPEKTVTSPASAKSAGKEPSGPGTRSMRVCASVAGRHPAQMSAAVRKKRYMEPVGRVCLLKRRLLPHGLTRSASRFPSEASRASFRNASCPVPLRPWQVAEGYCRTTVPLSGGGAPTSPVRGPGAGTRYRTRASASASARRAPAIEG